MRSWSWVLLLLLLPLLAGGVTARLAAADAPDPLVLAVVHTWGELLAQPAVVLAGGTTVHLGIEAESGPADAGPLVYCLSDRRPPDLPGPMEGEGEAFGPLHLNQPWHGSGYSGFSSAVPADAYDGFLFCMRTTPDAAADGRFTLLDGKRVVAVGRVVAAGSPPAWLALALRDADDGAVVLPAGAPEVQTKEPPAAPTVVLAIDHLVPALPACAAESPVCCVVRAAVPAATPLPTSAPDVANGLTVALDWRDGDLLLHLGGGVGLQDDVVSHLLLRWWIDGQPYVLPSHPELPPPAQDGQDGPRERLAVRVRGLPAALRPSAGRRVEVQVAWSCPGWWPSGDPMSASVIIPEEWLKSLVPVRVSPRVVVAAP